MSVTVLPRATARTAAAAPAIDGRLVRTGAASFAGHAIDPRDPARRLAVELLVDGLVVAVARADRYDATPVAGGADGHAFRFILDDIALDPGTVVAARVANRDLPVGTPLIIGAEPVSTPSPPGRVRQVGPLRFAGWTALRDGDAWVAVSVDGEAIAELRADGWTHDDPAGESPVPAFDLHLPDRFADGRVHRLAAQNAAGEALLGSPLAFVAEAAGAVPIGAYAGWRERHAPAPAAFADEVALIAAGDGAFAPTLASLEDQEHPDWIAVALPAAPGPAFDPAAALAFLDREAASSRAVIFCLAGTALHPGAVARLAAAIAEHPDAAAAYADIEIAAADGAPWPFFFPAFDRERFLEQGYAAYLFALPLPPARAAIAAGADDLYRLFHAAIAASPGAPVVALPGPLATLPRFDRDAAAARLRDAARDACPDAMVVPSAAAPLPAVHLARPRRESVAVAIVAPLVSERSEACRAALAPLLDRAGVPLQVVTAAGAAARIDALLPVPGEGTRARLVNAALAAACTDLVCILDDTIAVTEADWLDELLGRAAAADVAAVAPVIAGREGLVRHAGAVLGPGFAVAPAFADAVPRDPGHAGTLAVAHEVSALLPGCILYRRRAFHDVGGMDEARFPDALADADLCLRLRRAGGRVIVTPHARLVDTRGAFPPPSGRALRAFRARWGEALLADPFYSPALALDSVPWSALADPPRDMAARTSGLPPMVELPPGF